MKLEQFLAECERNWTFRKAGISRKLLAIIRVQAEALEKYKDMVATSHSRNGPDFAAREAQRSVEEIVRGND